MRRKKRFIFYMAGAALSAALCLGGCENGEASSAGDDTEDVVNVNLDENGVAFAGDSQNEETENTKAGAEGIAGKDEDAGENTSQVKDKVETVNVKAAADGSVQEITVEAVLQPQSGEKMEDVSNLLNIKNTKGEEEYVLQEDGKLLWDNLGEAIYYEGESQEALPVSMKITYYLDGKEIAPESLAGKSGKVTIRFDYENHTAQTVDVDGKTVEVKVPFVVMSTMILPSDVFSNIEVTNGKLMSVGEDSLVVGTAFPGLRESLKPEEFEAAEDFEIPEYVELTADVQDFALDFTASVIMPGLFADMDLDKLDDVDTLKEDMKKLEDASGELVEAAGELLDGTEEFKGYIETYTNGVESMDSGVKILEAGLGKLAENNTALTEGAKALEAGLKQLEDALLKADVSSADTGNMEELTACFAGLLTDAQLLGTNLQSMSTEMVKMENFAAEVYAYQSAVEAITQEVEDMLHTVSTDSSGSAGNFAAQINEEASRQAGANANKALESALAASELDEEEKQKIREAFVVEGIDLSEKSQEVWDKELDGQRSVMEKAAAKLQEIPELSIPQISMDISGIMTILQDMEKQLGILGTYAEGFSAMGEQAETLLSMLNELKSAVSQLSQGSGQLSTGLEAYMQGVDQICAGVKELGSGSSTLASAGSALREGADVLTEGMEAYRDGVRTFDEEGIQELSDLAGDDLEKIANRLRALQEADKGYDNFSGLAQGQTGSVRFLIETEEIK